MSLPTKVLLEKKKLAGRILDFGCGLGKDVELLSKMKINITGYDPHYSVLFPEGKFDTIICNYVLNILLPEEQVFVLMSVSELLKPGGKAYFTVRRDIKKNRFVYNPKYNVRTYQCKVILPFKSIFKTDNCEIYEYQHYTSLYKGRSDINIFLQGQNEKTLISESATTFSIFVEDSLQKGHCVIVPKKVVSSFFDLTIHEQTACIIMLKRVKNILFNQYNPNGFDIWFSEKSTGTNSKFQAHINIKPQIKYITQKNLK